MQYHVCVQWRTANRRVQDWSGINQGQSMEEALAAAKEDIAKRAQVTPGFLDRCAHVVIARWPVEGMPVPEWGVQEGLHD